MSKWWKNAIIYGVDVERYFDGNGDGIGDFPGLTAKLSHIASLGATCIWLLPFFPSTHRDNGYDVSDYYRVDPRHGSFEDFLRFVRAAGEYGIRIIIDLVAQHTSLEHPWFQSARHDPHSPYRDYYVWTDHPPVPAAGKGSMFPGEENSVWTFDEVAGSYYYHRFYSFQPGLNHRNPRLREELQRIIDFWLSFGIAGLRIDAASHLIEQPLDADGRVDESHGVLRQLHAYVARRKSDAVLLGEVDEDEHKLKSFFDGEQLDMMFNFFLNNYFLLALATERAEPLGQALALLPPAPETGQWANFLRNLDEADLERLNEGQRNAVLAAFAPTETMRIYGRGIRRRLAPMLQGNLARLKLAYSLLFSLPGAPLICYGDEIGMGEDLAQPGRNAVRIAMQWSNERNGGFSDAPEEKITQPVVAGGEFGFNRVNVQAQSEDRHSLLSFIRQLAQIRRALPEIGETGCHILESGSSRVFAHGYHASEAELLMLHNLSAEPATLDLPFDAMSVLPADLLGDNPVAPKRGHLHLPLEPYGIRWYRWER